MIEFRQKCFSEHDAMRSLYTKLIRENNWKNRIKVIDKSSLLPVLNGNNVVIERFVISNTFFGKDKYRMYLKLGAKVKLPDSVRLPGYTSSEKLGDLSIEFNGATFNNNSQQKNNSETGDNSSKSRQKLFSDGVLEQREFKSGGGGPKPVISSRFAPYINITKEKTVSLGETVKYDPKERSLVLEFASIDDAIRALDILPFGINYNLYLLA